MNLLALETSRSTDMDVGSAVDTKVFAAILASF